MAKKAACMPLKVASMAKKAARMPLKVATMALKAARVPLKAATLTKKAASVSVQAARVTRGTPVLARNQAACLPCGTPKTYFGPASSLTSTYQCSRPS